MRKKIINKHMVNIIDKFNKMSKVKKIGVVGLAAFICLGVVFGESTPAKTSDQIESEQKTKLENQKKERDLKIAENEKAREAQFNSLSIGKKVDKVFSLDGKTSIKIKEDTDNNLIVGVTVVKYDSNLENSQVIAQKITDYARFNDYDGEVKVIVSDTDNINEDNYISFVNGKVQDNFLY